MTTASARDKAPIDLRHRSWSSTGRRAFLDQERTIKMDLKTAKAVSICRRRDRKAAAMLPREPRPQSVQSAEFVKQKAKPACTGHGRL
jgi:hypothetical protein